MNGLMASLISWRNGAASSSLYRLLENLRREQQWPSLSGSLTSVSTVSIYVRRKSLVTELRLPTVQVNIKNVIDDSQCYQLYANYAGQTA